ncbi:MAG TPA: hypothetical protein VN132_01425, partial [Bdellovibrio sp.]|nr:hypothetical protein [Bdellovibrio sp.]
SEFAETQKTLREYLDQLEWTVLPLTINPNAAAQGALAIEILSSREDLKKLLATINHDETFQCAAQERKVLASFGGGCHQKIGVAALSRPYGQIQFLKGLSDQGQVLNKRELRKTTEVSQFSEHQLWWSDLAVSREPLPNKFLPENVNALFVARSEAWPENFQTSPSLCIWTAGLKTWKNLAQRGLWVHGCSEGLGEQEESRIEALTGSSLKWAKLSHEEGFSGNSAEKILIPTYKLITKDTESNSDFSGKESFFWNSGSQFLAAACKAPEILSKHHSCGPGNTYTIIRQYLEEKNIFTPSRLNIFLDQEDWRQQCTK